MSRELMGTTVAMAGLLLFIVSMASAAKACLRLLRTCDSGMEFEVQWMGKCYPRAFRGTAIGMILFAVGQWLIG